MSIQVLPREKGFGEIIGESVSAGAGPMLQQQLSDFYQQQQNKKFYKNLAEQLQVENPEKFSETFASLSPDQFGQFINQSRYTGLPQMLGLGGMPTGQAPTEDSSTENLQETYQDMIENLEKNIGVTEFGYGAKRALKTGFKQPTAAYDPKVQAFNAAGAAAVTIVEELFRKAQGRGLTQAQTKYVQDNFKITNDMTYAQARAVINQIKKIYEGQLPKNFPGIEKTKQETVEKKFEPKKTEEKQKIQTSEKLEALPEAKTSKGLTYIHEETGKRYRSDGTKWTLVKG